MQFKNTFCYVNGEKQPIFCLIYEEERLLLHDILKNNGISFTNNHLAYYQHFLININIDKYYKSNETVANEIFVSTKQVQRMKSHFLKCSILDKISDGKSNGTVDILKFNRLIKFSSNRYDNKQAKTKSPTSRDNLSFDPETFCPTKSYKEVKNNKFSSSKDKTTTDLIKFLYDLKLDKYQIDKIINENKPDYIKNLIDTTYYLIKNNPEKIKNNNTASFLWFSFHNKEFAQKYINFVESQKFKNESIKKAEKERIEKRKKEELLYEYENIKKIIINERFDKLATNDKEKMIETANQNAKLKMSDKNKFNECKLDNFYQALYKFNLTSELSSLKESLADDFTFDVFIEHKKSNNVINFLKEVSKK